MFPITCSSSMDSHSIPQRQSLQNKSVHLNVQPQPSPPRTPALLRCPRIPESPSLGIFCRQQREPTLYPKALSFSLEYKAENTITGFYFFLFATQCVLTDEALICLVHLRCCKFLLHLWYHMPRFAGRKPQCELGLLSCLYAVLNRVLSYT